MRTFLRRVPVIAVSGFVEPQEVVVLQALGVLSFLSKPFSLRDLGRALADPAADRVTR
jgi:CheY-like chemotaxis protein